MEIPHTVEARKDTGLWNAKIGIWLFLASEVMLFGGLFSSYIFLRMGSTEVWPTGVLNIKLGCLNTLVLIFSSVCVVMAWAMLKLRKYGKYQLWMGLTVLCAVVFMCVKTVEYRSKFTHHGIVLTDGTQIEGALKRATLRFAAREIVLDFAGRRFNLFKRLVKEKSGNLFCVSETGLKGALTPEWLARVRESLPEGVTRTKVACEEEIVFEAPRKKALDYGETFISFGGAQMRGRLLGRDEVLFEPHQVNLMNVREREKSLVFSLFGERKEELRKSWGRHREKIRKAAEKTGREPDRKSLEVFDIHGKDHEILHIPGKMVRRYSVHGPAYNNFYAIYFTLTGLHALHVVGGAIVLEIGRASCRERVCMFV